MPIHKDGVVRCVAVSEDGRLAACGDHEGNLRVYRLDMKDYPNLGFVEAHNS